MFILLQFLFNLVFNKHKNTSHKFCPWNDSRYIWSLYIGGFWWLFHQHVQNKSLLKHKEWLPGTFCNNYTSQLTAVWDTAPIFLPCCCCVFLWVCGPADTLGGSRLILQRRRKWKMSIIWCGRVIPTGLCLMPSPYKEPRNCWMLNHCPRCCLWTNSSPSCMTNIPSMYDSQMTLEFFYSFLRSHVLR